MQHAIKWWLSVEICVVVAFMVAEDECNSIMW